MLVQILTDRLIPGVDLLQRPLVDRGDRERVRQKLRVRMGFRYLKLCFHLHHVFVEFISHIDQLTGARTVQAAFLCLCHEVRDEFVYVPGPDGDGASAIERSSIEKSLPYLEWELSLFPHVKVIMLMGDVAKKAFNMISKKATGKNVIPPVSTYKIRKSEFWYQGIRIMPSYIMTGQNILIEKSKAEMAAEDISAMLSIIQE